MICEQVIRYYVKHYPLDQIILFDNRDQWKIAVVPEMDIFKYCGQSIEEFIAMFRERCEGRLYTLEEIIYKGLEAVI